MSYTYDSKPAGNYTNDAEQDANSTWGQTEATWGGTEWTWGEQIAITYDPLPTSDAPLIGQGKIGTTFKVSIYNYDEKPS
jgi:hypothetical protein